MSTENIIAANTISSFAYAVQHAYDRKSNDYLPVLYPNCVIALD